MYNQFTSLKTGYKNCSDFVGKFYYYYNLNDKTNRDPSKATLIGEAELGTGADLRNNGYNIAATDLKDTDIGIALKTQMDTTAFAIGDTIYIWGYFVAETGSYYGTKTSAKSRDVEIVASSEIELTAQTPVIYGEGSSATATVKSSYGIDRGTLALYIAGENGNPDVLVSESDVTLTDTDGTMTATKVIDIPADKIRGAKQYTLKAVFTPANATNFVDSTKTTSLVVSKRPVKVTVEDVNLNVGDTMPDPSSYVIKVIDGSLAFDDEIAALNLSAAPSTLTNTTVATSDTLNISRNEPHNTNYEITQQPGRITVTAPTASNTPPQITNAGRETTEAVNHDLKVNFTISDAEDNISDLTVTVTGKDGTTITLDSKNNTTGLCSFTASKNVQYTIVVKDSGNLESSYSVVVNNIDVVAPKMPTAADIVKSNTNAENDKVTVDINNLEDTANDGQGNDAAERIHGIKTITIDGVAHDISNSRTSFSFEADKNKDYVVLLTDNAGNTTTTTIKIDNIDKVKPVVNQVEYDKNKAVNSSVPVTISVSDEAKDADGNVAASGIAGIKSVVADDVPLTPNSDGKYIFNAIENKEYTIVVTDNAGNEETQTFTVDTIDVVEPEIKDVTYDKDTNTVTKDEITVSFKAEDTAAGPSGGPAKDGIAGVTSIEVNGTAIADIANPSFIVDKNGDYVIKVTDKAGNVTEKTITINNIDIVKPELSLKPNPDNTPADSVDVTITATDKGSDGVNPDYVGIDTITVKDSTGNNVPVTDDKFTVTKNDTYTVTVKDKAGNETTQTITINNIKAEEPSTEAPSTEAPSPEAPSTGDTNNAALYIILLMAMLAVGTGCLISSRKKA